MVCEILSLPLSHMLLLSLQANTTPTPPAGH